jgi:hypothetical protein
MTAIYSPIANKKSQANLAKLVRHLTEIKKRKSIFS